MATRKVIRRSKEPLADKPVELHVCFRIKLARQMKNRSRPWLSQRIGISDRQLRNIEQGIHRCGAGRLYQIAAALRVPLSFFYEDVQTVLGDDLSPSEISKLNAVDREMFHTARLLMDLKDPMWRTAIRRLVKNVTPYKQRRRMTRGEEI